MKYRKKPIEVEAIQFTGEASFQRMCKVWGYDFINRAYDYNGNEFDIQTMEQAQVCKKDSWIIKGIEGEFYPCKDSVFKKTYEIINE